jgi:hypothetical protein
MIIESSSSSEYIRSLLLLFFVIILYANTTIDAECQYNQLTRKNQNGKEAERKTISIVSGASHKLTATEW